MLLLRAVVIVAVAHFATHGTLAGQTAGQVLELVLPHARTYAPLSAMLSVAARRVFEPPQRTTVGIGTLAPADDSERIVKNVQFERNQDRINTFLAGASERPAHAGQKPQR